ncbi:hypothetical protein T484DRAFT_1925825 [Baffinella frigidus]|nr:hypothetical protein T484DRAFT_1925825 [Cryptophyta sp. CCMP2293]
MMRRIVLPLCVALLAADAVHGFVARPPVALPVTHAGRCMRSPAAPPLRMADIFKRIGALGKDKFDDSRKWVGQGADTGAGSNMRGAAGGVVVGALVAGPFGALVGGWLGKGAGLSNKAEEEELSRVGLTREDAVAMRELVMGLNGLLSSLRQSVADTQERVGNLRGEAERFHGLARERLEAGDEDGARKQLEQRQKILPILADAETQEAETSSRIPPLENALAQTADALQRTQERAVARQRGARGAFDGGAMDGSIVDPSLADFDKKFLEGK